MRVLIVNTDYPAFMSKSYGQTRDSRTLRSTGRRTSDSRRCSACADFYSQALRGMGHEARDVILNLEPAQKAWAREHGMSYNEGDRRSSASDAELSRDGCLSKAAMDVRYPGGAS